MQTTKTAQVSTSPKLDQLPLLLAPFRFRASMPNGCPVRLPDQPRDMVEPLADSLPPGWIVHVSASGYGFELINAVLRVSLPEVHPGEWVEGRASLSPCAEAQLDGPLRYAWATMAREFGWAVEAGYCTVRARVGSVLADHRDLPATAWQHTRVTSWLHGEAETETGEQFFDMQVGCTVETCNSGGTVVTDPVEEAPAIETRDPKPPKPRGRTKGTSPYLAEDEAFLDEADALIDARKANSLAAAAQLIGLNRIPGSSEDSKLRRLRRKRHLRRKRRGQ